VAEITASMVKTLREQTGAGMMECKKALEEAGGDLKRAGTILREKGVVKAVKRAGRVATEGLVKAAVSADKRTGALVELNIETDFAARSERFVKLTDVVCNTAAAHCPDTAAALLALKPVGDEESGTVEALVTNGAAVIGEKIAVRRYCCFSVPAGKAGLVRTYIHPPGKVGVMVELECENNQVTQAQAVDEMARDLCLQIAFSAPIGIDRDSVPADLVDQEREIYRKAALNEGKPEKVVEKIVEGRLKSYYKERCLVEQSFVKDEAKTVGALIAETAKAAGGKIRVARIVRFQLGEEVEGKE